MAEIPVRVAGHEVEAVLVPEMRLQAWYSGGEAHLRLPEPVEAGQLVTPVREPRTTPSSRSWSRSETSTTGRSTGRAWPTRTPRPWWPPAARPSRPPPGFPTRRPDDGLGRLMASKREQAERVVGTLDDEELAQLVGLLKGGDLSHHLLLEAARARLSGPVAA